MKLATALLASLAGAGAFAPNRPAFFPYSPACVSSSIDSSLYAGIGFDVSNLYSREDEDAIRAQNKLMEYLQLPSQVALRPNLGTNVVVSGFDPNDSSATMVLDFLNNEDSPQFPFKKIMAHVDDVKLARKRLIGRNARYTGLLDKLDFSAAESEGALPTVEQLAEISSWVAHVEAEDLSKISTIAEVAEAAPSMKNVAIVVSGAQGTDNDALKEAENILKTKATSFAYTLVVVGEWNDEPEASCAYGMTNITDASSLEDSSLLIGEKESFSREESLRIITECLAIDKAAGKCVAAVSARNTTSLESRLIQGMREIGYSRPQEIEHMVLKGAKGYNDMLAEREKQFGNFMNVTSEEDNEETKALKAKQREEARAKAAEKSKQAEIEKIAREWAKREYHRKTIQGNMPMSEAEYIDTVWDRAMFEADLKYRTMKGQSVNESEELQKFKEEQAKKKQATFEKVKKRFEKLMLDDLGALDPMDEEEEKKNRPTTFDSPF